MSYQPTACPDCLRHARLLTELAPYIERHLGQSSRRVVNQLLPLSDENLVAAVAPEKGAELLAEIAAVSADELQSEVAESDYWCCCRHDPQFPVALRETRGLPRALFGSGDPLLLAGLCTDNAVAIVGARRASSYGREVARTLGRDLAHAGLTVISGLAFGIDACAHRGALEGGTTVAVLGCGADVAYPGNHRSLWRRIREEGLVLSEMPLGVDPWRWTFPARNRIVAALAGMTVVVEAAQHSGSLITADLAADLGRDLGAVPGPVNSLSSAGTNDLLAGGACVVREAQDVLDAMLGAGVTRTCPVGPHLNRAQRAVLAALDDGAQSVEEIASDTDLPRGDAEAALSDLIALGYAEGHSTCTYTSSGLEPPSAD
jgi:DNA processing protein